MRATIVNMTPADNRFSVDGWNISDLVGLVGPIGAVFLGSVVALYIHGRRRRDDSAALVKSKADAAKELWYALHEMKAQAKRPGISSEPAPYEMENPYDINWLRDHFRKNASLLSSRLHDEYHTLLEKDIRTMFNDGWRVDVRLNPGPNYTKAEGNIHRRNLMTADFKKMQDVASTEWHKWEGVYKKMGGLDSPSE